MGLKLITLPAEEPVSLAEAKAQLRVATNDQDDYIGALIKAARQQIDGQDGWLGRALITQTWELTLDSFPVSEIRIPLPPLQSITSVKYDDSHGLEQTINAADYTVDTSQPFAWIIPNSANAWPATLNAINSVRVRFVAGYGAAAAVPEPIRQAILLSVRRLYSIGEQNPFISERTVEGVGTRRWAVSDSTSRVIEGAVSNLLSTYRVFQ